MLDKEQLAGKYLQHMDKIIMMCNDEEELRALGCAMMITAMSIMEAQIGEEKAQELLQNTVNKRYGTIDRSGE